MKYLVHSKASGGHGAQYISEHRDIASFGWHKDYKKNGRIELDFASPKFHEHLAVLINAAKATGAFPMGLKARRLSRKAKYIYDHPFFQKGIFAPGSILLGSCVTGPESDYISLNADGGTANNEPIELAQEMLRVIRNGPVYKENIKTTEDLTNSTVILIDPFPSLNNIMKRPPYRSEHLPTYAGNLIGAMRNQLLFDAKKALEAYRKDNYGLHLIAPSKEGKPAAHAIACGALGGFGGFLHQNFRIHDYFLGRHNCQSFIRNYFVADINEDPGGSDYRCIESVLQAYKNNPAAKTRFAFTKEGKTFVPIIPDVVLRKPLDRENKYEQLPEYKLNVLPENFMEQYRVPLKKRYKAIVTELFNGGWFVNGTINFAALLSKGRAADAAIDYITEDLVTRGLMKGKPGTASDEQENCGDKRVYEGLER